jgi:BirA family biotin operon repressor/biotin-[acetyl-CoA-carboxylase] ligase
MNAERIMQLSRAGADGPVTVEVVAETGSTNADLLARAHALEAPVLLAAEHQTAGRGRAGRSWLSAPGHSLTFSLAWKFDGGLRALSGLPLSAGSASRCS